MSVFSIFGKKRLKEAHIAQVFVGEINDLAVKSFPLMREYLNDVPDLKECPNIKEDQLDWFLYILFSANLYNLKNHFDLDQHNRLRILIIDEFINSITDKSHDEVLGQINIYEDFIASLDRYQQEDMGTIIALAIFQKYGLNECQVDHFARMNKPNPHIIKSMEEITEDYVWNWNDLLESFKLVA